MSLLMLKITWLHSEDCRGILHPSRVDLSIILGPVVPFRRRHCALFDSTCVQCVMFIQTNILSMYSSKEK